MAFGTGPERTGTGIGRIRLWDTSTWKEEFVLEGHQSVIFSIAFAPDGASLVSASRDGTIKLWPIPRSQAPAAPPAQQRKIDVADKILAPDSTPRADKRDEPSAPGTRVADLTDLPAASAQAAPAESPSRPRGLSALVLSLLLSLLALAGLGAAWLYRRQQRPSAKASTSPPEANPVATASPMAIRCSGCAAALKVKVAPGGKRVKCPKCGLALLVPREPGQPTV